MRARLLLAAGALLAAGLAAGCSSSELSSGAADGGGTAEVLPADVADDDAVTDGGPGDALADAAADAAPDTPDVPAALPDLGPDAPDVPVDTGPIIIPGDDCSLALEVPVSGLPWQFKGDTAPGHDDYSLGGGCGTGGDIGAGAPDAVFALTPAVTGFHVVGISPTTQVGTAPSVVYVVTDCADPAGSCVAVSQDLESGGFFSALLEAGTTYYVVVDGLLPADAGGYLFTLNKQVCTPQCPGEACGKDGCGGFCGVGCAEGQACRTDGVCDDPGLIDGNTCAKARPIDGVPFTSDSDTWYGTNEQSFPADACPGEPNPTGAGGRDHIYRFVPTDSAVYRMTMISDFDAALAVSSSCDLSVGCVGASDDSLSIEEVKVFLEAWTPYYVVVDGASNTQDTHGTYSLHIEAPCFPDCEGRVCGDDGCWGSCGGCGAGEVCDEEGGGQCVTAPPGEHCLTPMVIDALPFVHEADSHDFQNDHHFEAGDCPGVEKGWGSASNDMVYQFTPEASDLYTFEVQADFDSVLWVATDCADLAGSCFSGLDENITGESLELWLTAGQTYLVVLDGYGNLDNAAGAFTFTASSACIPQCAGKDCGPDNCGGLCGECEGGLLCDFGAGKCFDQEGNTCTAPFVVDAVPFSASGTTADAGNVYGHPYDGCPDETGMLGVGSREEVYAFTPTESAAYTIEVDADFDVTVYVTTDCTYFENDCYYEVVDEPLNWFNVWWSCRGKWEDSCQGLVHTLGVVADLPVWLEAGTTYFVVVDGSDNLVDQSGDYSISITAPCTPQCDGKQCGPDGCGLTCGECALGLVCDPDQQCVEQEGNACFSPFVVGELPWTQTEDTSDATNVYGLPKNVCPGQTSRGGAGSKDHAYAFTPPKTWFYDITVEADFTANVYLIDDCEEYVSTCFYKEEIGYAIWVDTAPGCWFGGTCLGMSEGLGTNVISGELEEGKTYYIIVDGDGGLVDFNGEYTITVEEGCKPECDGKDCGPDGCGSVCGQCPAGWTCTAEQLCANENINQGNACDNPWPVGDLPFLGTGDTTDDSDLYVPEGCSGLWGGQPGGRDEVWSFVPQQTGIYQFTVSANAGFEPMFYVAAGCEGLSYSCLAGTINETTSAALTAGETYHVIVDGAGPGEEGGYVLEIKKP